MRLRNISGSETIIAASPFVVQNPQELKGNWKSVFHNDNPIHIEIGMGKGQFLMEHAHQNPDINYIGIEKYSSVLLRAVEKTGPDSPSNIRFLCFDAGLITEIFDRGEVSRIYLNFSDPWPKERHAKRRLTSRQFLERYRQLLEEGQTVEFKTDNRGLFDFSLEEARESNWNILACTYDLHNDEKLSAGNIMTEYETKFSSMGNPIHKMIICT